MTCQKSVLLTFNHREVLTMSLTPPRMHFQNFFLFLSRSIFRWLRRGILQFFCSCCLYGAIYKTKLSVFRFFTENFSSPKEFSLIIFGKIRKTVNFVLLITPQRQRLQKNWSIPRRSQRKMLRDRNWKKFWECILGGVICTTKSAFLRYFEKSQNRQFCFAIFSIKIAPPEKTKYTMT